jgi:Response regulator containing a CheY-like receiver domain and an HTH DNA-binding domain
MSINIAIIEDDPTIREEMVEFFKKSKKVNCVMAVETITKFKKYIRDFMDVQIVLLDINLPEISGNDGLPIVRKLLPETNIIMHTVVDDYDTIFNCICCGANGYLIKNGNFTKLEETLLEIQEYGGAALSPSVARRILSYFQPANSQKQDTLSDQEIKISRLLVDGHSYQEIAEMLNITVNGVRYHIKNIYRKLHIHSKTALVKYFHNNLF